MPFKVKNDDVRAVMIGQIVLFRERRLNVKTIYWLSRLEKELIKNYRIYEEERLKLNNDYCKLDESGRPVQKDGDFQFTSEDKRRELFDRVNELRLLEIEIGIDRLKISLNDLSIVDPNAVSGAKASPMASLVNADEIRLLEPFIEFVDIV